MVKFGHVPKPGDEVIEQLVGSCLASFVTFGVGLRKPGKMIDHEENVLTSTTGGL